MKRPHHFALAALLVVPTIIFFAAKRVSQERPRKFGVHQGCDFLVFSPDGKTLMSTSSSMGNQDLQSTRALWDTQSGQQIRASKGREFSPQQLSCFSPDGKQTAAIETDLKISKGHDFYTTTLLLRSISGNTQKSFLLAPPPYPDYDEFWDRTLAVRWSSDGKEIIVQGGRDIRRVEPSTGRVSGSFVYRNEHNEWSMDALSPDGKMVAYTQIGGGDSNPEKPYAVLIDTNTAKRSLLPVAHITSWLTFSPHSQFIAMTHASQTKFVRVRDKKHLWTWSGASPDSFRFSTDEKSVVLCNGTVCVARDSQNGHELWRTKSIRSTIFALSPDGKTLAEARPNGQIFLRPLPS